MDNLDQRQIALVMARSRAVLGLVALVFPGLLNRAFLGAGAATPHAKALMRMAGIRDVALGVGALTSIKESTQGPEWLSMGALADGVDALAILLVRGAPRRARLVTLGAAAAAVAGLKLSRDLADERANAAPSPVEAGA
jgi:hypothetical protein